MGEITYELDLKKMKAPVKKGDIVGNLTIKEDGKVVNNVDITVEKSVDKAGLFTIGKISHRNVYQQVNR